MSAIRRAPLIGRRAVALLVGLMLLAGLVVVFGGSLTRSTDTEARAEQALAEVEVRKLQLAATEAELAFIDADEDEVVEDELVRWQARKLGFGKLAQGETLFTLSDGAPEPAPIRPIGPQDQEEAMAPFDAWMELLFGA